MRKKLQNVGNEQKAWLHNIGYGTVLSPGFDGTLPATERAVLDLIKQADKAQSLALNQNYKAVNERILLFETPEMMNKVIEDTLADLALPHRTSEP